MTELTQLDYDILKLIFNFHNVKTCTDILFYKYCNDKKTSKKAFYYRVYRSFRKLESLNLIERICRDKKAVAFKCTQRALDLFSRGAKFKPPQKPDSLIPVRATIERKIAIAKLLKKKMLNKDDRKEIEDLFAEYIESSNAKKILVSKIPEVREYDNPNPDMLIFCYKTRFTDKKRAAFNVKIYHNVWDTATRKYKRAVHLVLTTDPKRFKNIYEANRHFSKAFNRFMSYLTKLKRERLPYLAAYEFTKSGLLHCHLIIFGVNYLIHKKQITLEWERCGQGSYNWIYALKNDNGRWVYARQKPEDLKDGETAEDYVKKYLIKAQYNESAAALYWAFNKRFFTYSRKLRTLIDKKRQPTGIYEFWKTVWEWDLAMIYAMFSHLLIVEEIVELNDYSEAKDTPLT